MSIEESGSNLDRVFPTFILTLRDFTLDLTYQGKQISSDEYLERVCLSLQSDTSPKIHNSNMVRLCLREYFKIRKCFTFERPGGKAVLSCLDDLEDKDLDKEFVKDSQLFTDYVYNKCHPKQMNNGRPVNGRHFAILAESYVESIQNGKVPNVEGALNNLINLENTRAIKKSVRIYQSGMNALQYPTPDSSALFASHVVCHNEALDFFRRHSMSDVEGNYYYFVNSQLKQEYEKFQTRDQEESAKKSQEALDGLDSVVKQNVKDGRYHGKDGYKLYLKDMKDLESKYDSLSGLGCKKADMLDRYLRETASRGHIIMQADEALTKKEKEMEVERQRIADVERQKQAEKSLQEETKRINEEKIQMYQEALEKQMKHFAAEIDKERIHLQKVLEQRIQEMKRLETEGFSKEAERVSSYASKVQEELSEYHKEGALSLFGRAVKKLFW